jgi:hypothetical protein
MNKYSRLKNPIYKNIKEHKNFCQIKKHQVIEFSGIKAYV